MTRVMEIPDGICRRLEKRVGETGYTLPKLTVKLYSIWLDGGIELDQGNGSPKKISHKYTEIFGLVKDEIDPAAPHDMETIRSNIDRRRKDYAR